MKLIWVLWLLIGTLSAEEWFQKGSPVFLTAKQFQEDVMKDKSGYKVVKFFTPWCKYCRFMKDIFDKLKGQHPEWTLKFYEINCDPNAHFCGHSMNIWSYPGVKVFDQNGDELQTMMGYYQETIVYHFLKRYQNREIEWRKQNQLDQSKTQDTPQHEKTQPQKIKNIKKSHLNVEESVKQEQQPIETKNDNPAKPQQPAKPQPPTKQSGNQKAKESEVEADNKQDIEPITADMNEEQKKQKVARLNEEIKEANKHYEKNSLPVFEYLFYLMCALFGGYYFMHIMRGKDQDHRPNTGIKNVSVPIKIESKEDSQLLTKEVRDEDL